jgi:hypothetical protein
LSIPRLAFAFLALLFFQYATAADAAPPHESSATGAFVFSPYKDLLLYLDPHAPAISIATDDGVVPAVREGKSNLPGGVRTLTWAFATAECGAELWRDVPAQALADANVRAFDQAGVSYIISTGGAEGVFTCTTDEGISVACTTARWIAICLPRCERRDVDLPLACWRAEPQFHQRVCRRAALTASSGRGSMV